MRTIIQYLCQRCGYITGRKVTTCPACGDGRWKWKSGKSE